MASVKDAKVGDTFTLSKAVDAERSRIYGRASGDENPIHMDENVAKMAGLPTIILQGLCTMAFCQQTVVDWADKNPHLLKKIKVEFRGNVLPGDTVTVNGKVTEKKDDRLVVEFQATNQKGELVIGGGLAEVAVG